MTIKGRWLFIFCLLLSLTAYSQDDGVSLRLMSYNIRHGAGMDDVIDLNRQAGVIRDAQPDVVGLQEVDSCVKRSSYVHQAAVLAKSLGMYSTFGPAIPLTGGKYGVAILSKEKPLSHRNIPLPGKEKRTLLVCEFQEYVFACTHLDLEESNRLTSLNIILEEAANWDKPFFICGDWNDVPNSTLITKMKKNFTFLNNISNTSPNFTFPAGTPTKLIDYLASYGRVVKSVRNRKVINEPEASDHRPISVDVVFDGPTPVLPISQEICQQSSVHAQTPLYDLSGRRIDSQFSTGTGTITGTNNSQFSILNSQLKKGLYIVNGKKVMVK